MAESLRASLATIRPALSIPAVWVPSPLAFGAYFDLLVGANHGFEDRSLQAEAWLRNAMRNAAATSAATVPPRRPAVSTLCPPFHSEEEIARLVRWWDVEPDNAMGLRAVDELTLVTATRDIRRALEALRLAHPELADETACLIGEVVVAQPDGTERLDFGGASSFALWGAVAINARVHRDWRDYLKTLVHEAAHLLLFAIAREEPLVLNDPAERYASPLRSDRRPMDGVFHAAFVSAREAIAIDACLARLDEEPTVFEPGAREGLEALLEASVIAFEDCLRLIERDARLTPLGRSVLESATDRMRTSFSLVPVEARSGES